ncbi:MAG: class I SAM-dependent methyltransferase [Planctomycetota bacterium]
MERSLQILGLQTRVLRGTDPWRNIKKLRLTAEALKEVRTPYVIGADSCDVIFLDNPQIAVDRFRQNFACDLLFNATGSRCWPELPEFVRFQSSLPMAAVAQQRHWINSGLFIGKTEFCREYFARLAEQVPVEGYEYCDQAIVMRTWPEWYPRVQADYLSQIFQWFNEDRTVMRVERRTDPRQTSLINWLRRLPMPIIGAEIGVFDGHTSEVLLRELPYLKLWMVDPWKPFKGESLFDEMNAEQFEAMYYAARWWTEFAHDRRFVLPEASPRAATRFADASLDFAFIDANHLYECVRADIAAWWPKVRPGGLLTGHDYGVYRDTTGEWGVRRAVDEFAQAIHREVTLGADGTWCVQK